MIEIKTFPVGFMGTNAYLVQDSATKEAAVIDPGFADDDLTKALDEIPEGKLRYVLLTHGHFDHIGGAEFYAKRYGAKIVISCGDAEFLSDKSLNLCGLVSMDLAPFCADIEISQGDKLTLGETEFYFLLTPGHTRGSGCFVFEADRVIFSGDTLFYGSMGRTDFPTSNPLQMVASLHTLRDLEGDYKVYPGHDISTTLSLERSQNPYLR